METVTHGIQHRRAILAGLDDVLGPQHGKLLRDGGLVDSERFLELVDAPLAPDEDLEDTDPDWVREGLEEFRFEGLKLCAAPQLLHMRSRLYMNIYRSSSHGWRLSGALFRQPGRSPVFCVQSLPGTSSANLQFLQRQVQRVLCQGAAVFGESPHKGPGIPTAPRTGANRHGHPPTLSTRASGTGTDLGNCHGGPFPYRRAIGRSWTRAEAGERSGCRR